MDGLTPVSLAIVRADFPPTHMDTNLLRSESVVGWEGYRFIIHRDKIIWVGACDLKSADCALYEGRNYARFIAAKTST